MLQRRGFFFFFQAEDGIRDVAVTGVQTCALPICRGSGCGSLRRSACQRRRRPSPAARRPDSSRRYPSHAPRAGPGRPCDRRSSHGSLGRSRHRPRSSPCRCSICRRPRSPSLKRSCSRYDPWPSCPACGSPTALPPNRATGSGSCPLTYRFGMTQTPWLDWEEALWDYRMQGTMAMDRNGYMTASDLGFAVDGKWNSDRVNFAADVVNGQGYHATSDGHKDVQGRLSVRVIDTDDSSRVGGLRVTGYAGVGKPNGGGTRNRFLGMVSYRSKQYTLAA